MISTDAAKSKYVRLVLISLALVAVTILCIGSFILGAIYKSNQFKEFAVSYESLIKSLPVNDNEIEKLVSNN